MTTALVSEHASEPATWTTLHTSGSFCGSDDLQTWTIQRGEDERQVRKFLLHVPPTICVEHAARNGNNDDDANGVDAKYPILLAFHGYGGGPMHEITKWLSTCRDRNFILVAPQGSTNTTVDKSLGWNAIDCCGYPASHGVDDVDFTFGVIEALKSNLDVADTSNVVATGFSNGGFFTSLLGLLRDRPTWLKAIVPTGGYQYDRSLYTTNMEPLPMFAHHGGADTVVRPGGCCLDPRDVSGKPNCPANIGSLRDTCLPVHEAFTLWSTINQCQYTTETSAIANGTTCWVGSECRARTKLCIWHDKQHVWGSQMPGVDMVGEFLEELQLTSKTQAHSAAFQANSLTIAVYPLIALGVFAIIMALASWIRKPHRQRQSEKRVIVDQQELTDLVVASTATSLRIRSPTGAV